MNNDIDAGFTALRKNLENHGKGREIKKNLENLGNFIWKSEAPEKTRNFILK